MPDEPTPLPPPKTPADLREEQSKRLARALAYICAGSFAICFATLMLGAAFRIFRWASGL